MRAVVLVGGLGTRLRPLTLTRPKQMLPIVNRPMIEHVVGHLGRHGVDEVVLSLGYRPDVFRHAYPDATCAGVRLHYAVEPERLDTAGAISFAARDAGIDERFLVLNGDVLTDLDVTAFDDPSRYGVVPTDPDGRVIAFVEKPPPGTAPSSMINAGTYVLEPDVLDRIVPGRPMSVEREVFPGMVADGTLFAADDDAYWIDTGTPREYIQAQLDLIDGRRAAADAAAAVHPSAVVDPGAAVRRSVVGPGSEVAAGAYVEDSVLLDGVRVGDSALVASSIVGSGSAVAAGARVEGFSVVGDAQVVGPGERLDGVRRPEACP